MPSMCSGRTRFNSDPPLKLAEFDWLADHHMAGYLNGIARLLPRVPRRKHPEYVGLELEAVPLHYLDEPVRQAVPPPKMLQPPPSGQPAEPARRGAPSAPAIAQSDPTPAYLKQPQRRQ